MIRSLESENFILTIVNCAAGQRTPLIVLGSYPIRECQRNITLVRNTKAAVQILPSQPDTPTRYPNSILGNHQSSVNNQEPLTRLRPIDPHILTSLATSWPNSEFDIAAAININQGDWLDNHFLNQTT